MKLLPCQLFQLTSPRGGWHSADLPNTTHGIFQLTSSRGGWQWCMLLLMKKMYFNSHPHKEDDVESYCIKFITIWYFNSHPHKEDDYRRSQSHIPVSISTHILTRRMTRQFQLRKWPAEVISTHILTRRMTTSFSWIITPIDIFQLTSSRGGWRHHTSKRIFDANISTHILTRRMTLQKRQNILHRHHFNSHPHEEDDACSERIN